METTFMFILSTFILSKMYKNTNKCDEYRNIFGLCISHLIKCTICHNYIEKKVIKEHFHSYYQVRINKLLERSLQTTKLKGFDVVR